MRKIKNQAYREFHILQEKQVLKKEIQKSHLRLHDRPLAACPNLAQISPLHFSVFVVKLTESPTTQAVFTTPLCKNSSHDIVFSPS